MKVKSIALLLTAVMGLSLVACGSTDSPKETTISDEIPATSDAPSDNEGNEYPVTIENMGVETTYENVPDSAVALSYSIAEIMVALGLKDKIVGVAPSMYILDQVSAEYRDEVGSLPTLEGEYGVPSVETVLATNADFVYGDAYSFYASSVGTREDFDNAGVDIYATEGTYVDNPTFENTYNDILNIGKIFNVEDRAQELVEELRKREDSIREKVEGLDPVSVFYYDSDTGGGVAMSTIGDTGLQQYMLKLAGCKNIFSDTEGEFIDVSWEDVIDRNPEYIIVCDYYGSGYADEKIAEMKENPDTAQMDAVKNDRFIVVPGLAMFPSIENTNVVEQIATAVHP